MRRIETLNRATLKDMFAFSLVELMISLITISCIAAAFTPVITKKLKKQDIALSIAQTSEITNQCSGYEPKFTDKCRLCTKAYCIQCGIDSCDKGQYLDTSYCGCKSCSEKFGANCTECDKNKCTRCSTAPAPGYIVENGACKQCPSSSLPSDGVSKCGVECKKTTGYYCDGQTLKSCTTFNIRCSDCDKNTGCKACQYQYYLKNGECLPCNDGSNHDLPCIRCNNSPDYCTSCNSQHLLNTTTHKCQRASYGGANCMQGLRLTGSQQCIDYCNYYTIKTGTGEKTTTNFKCATCHGGYYVTNSGQTCSPCSAISNCMYCNNDGTCTQCNEGFSPSANKKSCISCSSIANCVICRASSGSSIKCSTCIQGYHTNSNETKCEKDNNNFSCSDSNFMQVVINDKKYCITRRNMGDSTFLNIPNTIKIADSDSKETCYSQSGDKCCWKGLTSSTSTKTANENSGYTKYESYPADYRTVCNYVAADEICKQFNYAGKTWRLPTMSEGAILTGYSINRGDNGLQLCQEYGNKGSNCCNRPYNSEEKRCLGTPNSWCDPTYCWSNNKTLYGLYSGGPVSRNANYAQALSVRCITEM